MTFLRHRVRAGESMVGTFVKTTSPQTVEVLALAGLDFILLDAEHAPFGIESISLALGAAVANRLAALVRVPDRDPAFINSCLDLGAEGVLVPHVRSVAHVEAIADAVKYGRGRRGFSPSTRAGGYGALPPARYRSTCDERSTIWCQIEDTEALEAVEDIAAHDAVDCLFIGPADLGWSLCPRGPDPSVLEPAIDRIVATGRRHDRAVGMFLAGPESLADALKRQISVIVSGSDQSMLLEGARRLSHALVGSGGKDGPREGPRP